MPSFIEVIGWVGALLVLVAYGLVSTERLSSRSLSYQARCCTSHSVRTWLCGRVSARAIVGRCGTSLSSVIRLPEGCDVRTPFVTRPS